MRPFLLLLACLAALRAEDKVIGGPYAVKVTGRSATIGWVVQTREARVDGRTIPVLRPEKVSLTGLTAGKLIEYDVLSGDPQGKGSFRTAPPAGARFNAVVFGDTRTRHELHQRIVDQILKEPPEVVFHTGDLVADGLDLEQWPRYFAIEREILKRVAFFPALGNHERNSRQFYEFFDVSTPYYSVDWGSAHFTLLNTDLGNVAISPEAKEAFWREQTRWMEDDLAKAAKAEFRFVVMHHPPFTAVKSRQGDNREVRALTPLFEKHKVDAVFAGHDHNYQRHVFGGVQYIVTGGGGAPLYGVEAPIPGITQKVESTEHIVRMRVEPGRVTLEAVALDGHVIETFELKH